MGSFLKKYKFILILIPLGLVIAFLGTKILDGFLASSKVNEHYLFLGVLLAVVITLVIVILKWDKKNEEGSK